MKKWYKYPKFESQNKCRFCPHIAFAHLTIRNVGQQNQEVRWDKCGLLSSTTNHSCNCPGFGPIDNLVYLEMKSDE